MSTEPEVHNSDDRKVSLRLLFRSIWKDKLTGIAFCYLLLLLVCIFLSGLLPYEPTSQDLLNRNLPPMTQPSDGGFVHILGTDPLGRDTLSRILSGGRVSLFIGVASVLSSAAIGIPLGIFAGYTRGRADDMIMRLVDIQMSTPFLLLALLFLYIFGTGFLNIIFVFAIARWPVYARVARGIAMSVRELPYIDASRVLGASNFRIMRKHVVPNAAAPLVVIGTLEIAKLILAESTLSFLGIGVQPPQVSWGLMISQGRDFLQSAPGMLPYPG